MYDGRYKILDAKPQVELDKLDDIVEKEIEQIRGYPRFVAAWWKPEYSLDRMLELTININSKNKDIEYINQSNKVMQPTGTASAAD